MKKTKHDNLERELRRLDIPFFRFGDKYSLHCNNEQDAYSVRECWATIRGIKNHAHKPRNMAKKIQNRRLRHGNQQEIPQYKRDWTLWN